MLKFLRSTATLAALVIGIAGATLVLYAWRLPPFTSSIETTDNAYVRGQLTVISPQLAGYVAEVAVQDFQKVTAGQLLVRIDDRIFQQKLEQAKATLAAQKAALANSEQTRRSSEAKIKSSEAQVDSAKAALKAAGANWERIEPLLSRGVTTQKEADQARANLDQAKAALSQAQAAVEVARQDLAATLVNRSSLEAAVQGAEAVVHLAEIDLQNTRIVAPRDGRLGEIGARIGQYVSAGTQLLAVVPETIWVDALEHASLTGHIERFSPAAGSEFSVLKADNATGNFTKVAQRVPVRIAIDPDQNLVERLAPGMSVEVSVNTEAPAGPKSFAATGGVALR
jgi:multidrug resistance efflux pump